MLCAIFVVPVAALLGLLTHQSVSAIAFSEKERDGVAYLQHLAPIMSRAARNVDMGSAVGLIRHGTLYDVPMQSWEESTRLRVALASPGANPEIVNAARELVRAIGDGSNLILDPDLDSRYVMDIAVLRLPMLVEQAKRSETLAVRFAETGSRAVQDRLRITRGQILILRKDLEASMLAAIRNNPGQEVSRGTLRHYGALVAAIDLQLGALDEVMDGGTSTDARAIASFRAANIDMIRHTEVAWIDCLAVLDELLAKRINAQKRFMIASTLGALLAIAVALFFALGMSRRIARNVALLSSRIHSLTTGDLASPIPLQDEGSEVGEIARSLTVFRAHAEERQNLAETLEAERAQTRQQLEQLAFYDDLTGLPNRKFLLQSIDTHARESTADRDALSALIYVDLDGFKEVNDTMTHSAGDEVLRQVAERLADIVGDQGCAARLGGDEFACFLPCAPDRVALEAFAGTMRNTLAAPYQVFASEQFLSASLGIATMALSPRCDSSELIRQADVAMYRSKARGKNRVVFFQSTFDDEAHYRKMIETALRDALQAGEVQMHFQPQYEAASGRLIGVEGLARWKSHLHGDIAPSVFIPVAEQSGLIYELGLQMLRQALVAAERWPGLRVSLNLSVAQLRHAHFLRDVAETMRGSEHMRGRIELEVTESILMEEDELITAKLLGLRQLGFELALDDFGTGYSSIDYLSRYHFDRLKIDRAFVRRAADSPRGSALLRSIAAMGRALGMDVCAEGVETRDDVEQTVNAGCTLLQGFYFSPAVRAVEIDDMINANTVRCDAAANGKRGQG